MLELTFNSVLFYSSLVCVAHLGNFLFIYFFFHFKIVKLNQFPVVFKVAGCIQQLNELLFEFS